MLFSVSRSLKVRPKMPPPGDAMLPGMLSPENWLPVEVNCPVPKSLWRNSTFADQ
jgi:hypothetical protein